MAYDLSYMDRIAQRFERVGTSLFIRTVHQDTGEVLDSFEFTNAPSVGQPLPNEVMRVAQAVLGAMALRTPGDKNLLSAPVALADAAATLTATQLVNARVFTITPTVARTLTTATAGEIVAALPNYSVGTSFEFTIVNAAAFDVTLAAGTGVTLVGKAVANNVSGTWVARVDSATAVTLTRK